MNPLAQVEATLQQNARFQHVAPEQYAKMKQVLEALKKAPAGKPASDDVKKLVLEVVRWQFEVQAKNAQAQAEALEKEAAISGDSAVAKAAVAFRELAKVLVEARDVSMPASLKAGQALEAGMARVAKAFQDANEAAARPAVAVKPPPPREPSRPVTTAPASTPRAPAAPTTGKPPAFGRRK